MLLKVSETISEKIIDCLARAADLRECANAATDPRRKAHLFDTELRWLRLVESYRLLEQADRFLENAQAGRERPSAKTSAQSGVLVVTCPTTGREFSTGVLVDTESLVQLPYASANSYCPHCSIEHVWWTKDAKLVGASLCGIVSPARNRASLVELLEVLVQAAIEHAGDNARAAFYRTNDVGSALYHITGMTQAYAQCVAGFAIGPQSLGCGLAAYTRQAVITPDVFAEPRWQPWLWLAKQFDYRACWSFPIETPSGKIVGSFGMYYEEPTEATPRDLHFASKLTRTAATIISRYQSVLKSAAGLIR